jgi:DNA-binding Lrp family transcriptional regulator
MGFEELFFGKADKKVEKPAETKAAPPIEEAKPDGRFRPTAEKAKAKRTDLRAGMMAIDRAMGQSISDIAATYKVSNATVKAYLSAAEEEGFIDHYRRSMYDRLGSKVLAVYEAHLDQGSLSAARDLAQGLGILQNAPPKIKEKSITTLAEWRAEKGDDVKTIEVKEDAPIN